MDTKKRMRETHIWEARWYSELSSLEQHFYQYIADKCNNVGIWSPNFRHVAFHLKLESDPNEFGKEFLKNVNKHKEIILVLESRDWFIKDFVKEQYCKSKPLGTNNNAHKSYLRDMKRCDIWKWFCENQPETMPHTELEHFFESKRFDDSLDMTPAIKAHHFSPTPAPKEEE